MYQWLTSGDRGRNVCYICWGRQPLLYWSLPIQTHSQQHRQCSLWDAQGHCPPGWFHVWALQQKRFALWQMYCWVWTHGPCTGLDMCQLFRSPRALCCYSLLSTAAYSSHCLLHLCNNIRHQHHFWPFIWLHSILTNIPYLIKTTFVLTYSCVNAPPSDVQNLSGNLPVQILSLDYVLPVIPPFCVSQRLSELHIQLLRFVPVTFPILLVIIIFFLMELHARNCRVIHTLWKPFSIILDKTAITGVTNKSVIHAFASFIFLANSYVFTTFTNLVEDVSIINREDGNMYKHSLHQ